MQDVDGGLDGLSIAISDERGDVMVDDSDEVEALTAHLCTATAELERLSTGYMG